MDYALGATKVSLDVQIVDDSGLPVTGLVAATWPAVTTSEAGPYADSPLTLSDLASITAAWSSGGVKERGGGVYRLDLPNVLFTIAGQYRVRAEVSGKHLIAPNVDVAPFTTQGAYSAVITVTDTASNPIQNALVRLTLNAASYPLTTNASGQVTFDLDNGTWAVTITAAGYSFSGANLTVAGANLTVTYQMTKMVISSSAPGTTTGYFTTYDQFGNVLANVSITATFVSGPPGDTGHAFDNTGAVETSNAAGLVQFLNLVLGATYQFTRGTSAKTVTIPLTAGTSYALPSMIGTP